MSISDIATMVAQILKICNDVKKVMEKADKTEKDYRDIEAVVDNLYAMVQRIEKTDKMREDPQICKAVRVLMERLENAQIKKVVGDIDGKNVMQRLRRLLNANDEADKLNQVESKINQAIQNLHFAISFYSDSTVTKIHEDQQKLLKESQEIRSLSNNLVAAMTQSMQVFAATFQMHQELTLPEGPGGETTGNVIRTLGFSDTSNNDNLPELYPLVLRFPLGPGREHSNKEKKEPGREIRDSECSISLVNKTGNHVGILIQQTEPTYHRFETCIIMVPHSTLATSIELNSDTPRQPGRWAKLKAWIIEAWSHDTVERLLKDFIDGNNRGNIHNWEQKAKSNKAKIHPTKLTAVACELEKNEVLSKFEVWKHIRSIDVHPTAPRILITHADGHLTIWDYQRKKQLKTLVHNKCGIKFVSAKYICQHGNDWMATGDDEGFIHVYDCTALIMDKVTVFEAHKGKSVDSLAVHPTESQLLSSSSTGDETTIKLWYLKIGGAVQIQEFKDDKTKHGVLYLTFNPRDPNTFACVSKQDSTNKRDSYAMVWNIESPKPSKTLPRVCHAEFVFSQSNQQFLVTSDDNVEGFQIWNLQTANEPIHTLNVWFDTTVTVASHPTIPMLATFSKYTGTVCLWDASTYRLKRKVYIESGIEDVKLLFANISGLPRLVVAWNNSANIGNIVVLDAAPIERPSEEDQALADAYLTIESMSEQAADGVVSSNRNSNRQHHNTGNNGGVHVHENTHQQGMTMPPQQQALYSQQGTPPRTPAPARPRAPQRPSAMTAAQQRQTLQPSTYSYSSPESSCKASSPWKLSIPSRSRGYQSRHAPPQQPSSTLQHGANNNPAWEHGAQHDQGRQHNPPQHANHVAQQHATTTMHGTI